MANKPLPFSLCPLDQNFVGAKPIERAPDVLCLALESKNNLIIQRKRNGNAAYATITSAQTQRRNIQLYSRGIHNLTAHFPAIADELHEIDFPHDTLLAGEMLVQVNGVDAPDAFGRFARSHPKRAVELQKTSAPIRLALFNIIVYKGADIIALSYGQRLEILRELLARHHSRNISVIEVLDLPFQAAQTHSIENRWEGLVLYDKRAPSAYRLDGRTDLVPRPEGCWKWKPYIESDFIATGWVPSTATAHAGMVKDLLVAQYDPDTRQLVSWGKVGVGLTEAERREFANDALYPMVFEIKFERRTPNCRLIQARILRRRHDKSAEECFSPRE